MVIVFATFFNSSNIRRKPFSLAGDFKSPGQGGPTPESPGNAKKKRRGSSAASQATQQNNSINDLVPPPLSGYGDTIIASNPFDDTPPPHPQMGPMGGGPMNQGMGPMGGPHGQGMGGPPMGGMMGMNQMGMNSMGPNMNPMNNMGNVNMNMGMSNMGPMNGMNQGPMNMGCGMGSPGFGGPGMGPKPMSVTTGKIYPPDQPMVFNPQNPNAPPIYPCGICHKEVHDNDQAILCESGCNFWFHRVCTGLTEAAYHLLTAEVYAEWVCDKCLSSKNIPQVKFKP